LTFSEQSYTDPVHAAPEVSFYGAAYHALALIHSELFVAADTRYVNRVTKSRSVIALSEWQPKVQ
jgi:hypothetical protein